MSLKNQLSGRRINTGRYLDNIVGVQRNTNKKNRYKFIVIMSGTMLDTLHTLSH